MDIIIFIVWLLLGIHSAYYFIKSYTKYYDLTTYEIPLLIFCVIAPLATHIATYIVWGYVDEDERNKKILFKKKEE